MDFQVQGYQALEREREREEKERDPFPLQELVLEPIVPGWNR
jgi:hypothetical protein